MGGLILSASALEPLDESIRCLWAFDAGTMGAADGCNFRQCSVGGESTWCWWPPTQLASMLTQHLGCPRPNSGCNLSLIHI